jgi:hypothetical protein
MSIAIVTCRAQLGLHAPLVQVEVSLGSGLPAFSIVGLHWPQYLFRWCRHLYSATSARRASNHIEILTGLASMNQQIPMSLNPLSKNLECTGVIRGV